MGVEKCERVICKKKKKRMQAFCCGDETRRKTWSARIRAETFLQKKVKKEWKIQIWPCIEKCDCVWGEENFIPSMIPREKFVNFLCDVLQSMLDDEGQKDKRKDTPLERLEKWRRDVPLRPKRRDQRRSTLNWKNEVEADVFMEMY